MHDYGGMPAGLAALAVLVLAAALSLYVAGAMALFAWRRRDRPLIDAAGFAACWLLAELARGQLFTGFPWIASGYAHSDGPLSALAPWVGVYGIGAAAAFVAAAIALSLRPAGTSKRPWLLLGTALALPLLPWLAPREFTESTGRMKVSLLQPNVPQDLKFDPRAHRRPDGRFAVAVAGGARRPGRDARIGVAGAARPARPRVLAATHSAVQAGRACRADRHLPGQRT
jgi:apolipoprotein N-acyltransferase